MSYPRPVLIATLSLCVAGVAFIISLSVSPQQTNISTTADKSVQASMSTVATAKQAVTSVMSTLSHAKITHRPSKTRGHADHGWLNTYHSFSFANWYAPQYESFGALRVLNEDRVAPNTGFPTHPHRNAEIFSYILSGELTHRDSMQTKGAESDNKDKFYRMQRGDVQFTTGGSGIAHSEENEHERDWVHFLQIWATPWKQGLRPIYHTSTFPEADKRQGFVKIITPLKAGPDATAEEEQIAEPTQQGTIPIHADMVFAAGIIAPRRQFQYVVGEGLVRSKLGRHVYVHLPMTKKGSSQIRLDGRSEVVLREGDGAFVSQVNDGDVLTFESIGSEEAEVVVLDSN